MIPSLWQRILGVLAFASAVYLSVGPAITHAGQNNVQQPTLQTTENIEEDEEPGVHDDGSGALQDRYMHLDLKNIKPLSLDEEEALLGNWGDADAEAGD